MDLTKITDLTNLLGVSSRSLRYYEQTGLIKSARREHEKYRYYDAANIERLKQIIVLRKMQIPIKDIIRIYESEDMSVVVEAFVNRLRAIDEEAGALAELRRVVEEFLRAMIAMGVTKISALPILYEKMEKQFESAGTDKKAAHRNFRAIPERVTLPIEPRIINLPGMRAVYSRPKGGAGSDAEGFWRWVQASGVPVGEPGMHERFELLPPHDETVILKVPGDFVNDGPYSDHHFEGGLYASADVYLDEDLGGRFDALVSFFNGNKFYEIDYDRVGGDITYGPMLEDLIPADSRRELVSMFVPVKKRLADPELFGKPAELAPGAITADEIERQNPVLWEAEAPLGELTPINGPHYRLLESGEAEYTGWISTRVLSTNVCVRLPFRVDIEFRVDGESARYGYGGDEGSIVFYHGDDLNYFFGVNCGNRPGEFFSKKALRFHQPIFRDYYDFPGRGAIIDDAYNKLTWIVGEKHFAVIINGEIRYCGMDFPYMAADLSRQEEKPVIIGSNGQGMKYFRSVRVSQLGRTKKNRAIADIGAFAAGRSNNAVPRLRRFITSEHGENYWFNGCARYVMETLGETDFGYEFFAGLTGDVFTQVFSRGVFCGDGFTDFMMNTPGGGGFLENIFSECGYSSSFVPAERLRADADRYLTAIISDIDRGVPVIGNLKLKWRGAWFVIVGYEERGATLKYMTDNMTEPERVPAETIFTGCSQPNANNKHLVAARPSVPEQNETGHTEKIFPEQNETGNAGGGWLTGLLFIGSKVNARPLGDIYRSAVASLPAKLTLRTENLRFGAEAFEAWADEIEGGKFDDTAPEEFDGWKDYCVYVCNLATNGSCCHGFLDKAMELNPDLGFLSEVAERYKKMMRMWNDEDGKDLEALGGGFNISLETLKDKSARNKIAAKLREFAAAAGEAAEILNENMRKNK